MSGAAGYASRAYAESLAEFGDVIDMLNCGGALLGQTIAGAEERDAVGPYPLFACRDWSGLSADRKSVG